MFNTKSVDSVIQKMYNAKTFNELSVLKEELEVLTRCPTCAGTGEIDNSDPYGIVVDFQVCPDCNGTGLNTK